MPFVAMNSCPQDHAIPAAYPIGVSGLSASAPDCQRLHDDPSVGYNAYAAAGCLSFNPGAGTFVQSQPQIPPTAFGQKVNVVSNAVSSLLNPLFQAQTQAQQSKLQAQQEAAQIRAGLQSRQQGDYTNYYLIGGGLLLAGLLIFAVGRRRRSA